MSGNLETQNSAKMPVLSRMRSQRIVHVVQTEENNNDVSVVVRALYIYTSPSILTYCNTQTMSEDGHAEKTQETVDFDFLSHELKKEPESVEEADTQSIFFEIDLDDGDLQRLTLCESEDHQDQDDSPSRRGSIFSDDEFESIRMTLPKRTPTPSRLRFKDMKTKRRANGTHPSLRRSPPSIASYDSSHSGSTSYTDSDLNHRATFYDHGLIPNTAASSATLFSMTSSTSSTTCVDYSNYPKSGGRTFCAFDEGSPAKLVGIVTPDSVTGTRGLDDLRMHGYAFDWSRFAGRSEAPHGLSPEDSADLEIFLSRVSKLLTYSSSL